MEEATKRKKFGELSTAEEFIEYIEQGQWRHQTYSHYSLIANIDKILGSKVMWFSPSPKLNDLKEKEDDFYSISFCAVCSENIPMWYLYGGVDGKGARIDLSKANFCRWLSRGDQSKMRKLLVLMKNENGQWNADTSAEAQEILSEGVLSIEAGDVLYIAENTESNYNSEDKKHYRAKYNSFVNNDHIDEALADALYKRFGCFCKPLPWFYEKEFRIVVRVSGALKERLERGENKLGISLEPIFSKIKVVLGPERDRDFREEFKQTIDNFPGIRELSSQAGPVRPSDLVSGITMRLCGRCNYGT